jgi:hypothetical protein
MHDASFAVLVSVAISSFFALIAHTTVCAEQHHCLERNTCYSLQTDSTLYPSCSFRTTITPSGYRMLNASMQYSTMEAMNRGICVPGLRQQVDSVTGAIECVRKRSWPRALNEEIGNPDAETDHGRYCGKWISSGSIAYGDEKWAFYDSADTARDVDNLVRAKGATSMAATDLGKFRASCRTMVASNAAGASSKQAYDLLVPGISTDSLGVALESVGFLASHYCDAPALVGVGMVDDQFVAKVLSGVVLDSQALRNALYVVGEERSVRNEAVEFRDAMSDFLLTGMTPTTQQQANAIARGSYRGTWIDGYVRPSFTQSITYTAYNYPLERFVAAFASQGSRKARSYALGVAAVCSLAAQSVVVPEVGSLLPFLHSNALRTQDGAQGNADALGRLVAHGDDIDSIDENTLLNASTVRLSQLSALASASRLSAREVCLAAAKRVFPDEFDRITFNALVTPRLYARLELLSNEVREAAALTLAENVLGNIFSEFAGRSAAVSKIRATKVRIAGAPRGSWAGIDREFRRPYLASGDSALTMIVKQARAVYLDRLLPVVTGAGICEHPALFAGVSRNAYLLLTSTSACSMILPGLVVPPFADERYDDESLVTRLGFVMAHEFMHVTAIRSQWNEAYVHKFLESYPPSTKLEAMADLGAAATLMRFLYVRNDTVCASVSQMFCGRVGWAPVWNPPPPWHPPTNMRGDNVCAFLRKYYAPLL